MDSLENNEESCLSGRLKLSRIASGVIYDPCMPHRTGVSEKPSSKNRYEYIHFHSFLTTMEFSKIIQLNIYSQMICQTHISEHTSSSFTIPIPLRTQQFAFTNYSGFNYVYREHKQLDGNGGFENRWKSYLIVFIAMIDATRSSKQMGINLSGNQRCNC